MAWRNYKRYSNVGEEALVSHDQEGIVRIGARVNQGDILVGKITQKVKLS